MFFAFILYGLHAAPSILSPVSEFVLVLDVATWHQKGQSKVEGLLVNYNFRSITFLISDFLDETTIRRLKEYHICDMIAYMYLCNSERKEALSQGQYKGNTDIMKLYFPCILWSTR